MSVRTATAGDLPTLEGFWRAFEAEIPPPQHEDVDEATELGEIREIVESGLGWVAERDGTVVGMALARRRGQRAGRLTDLYVTPEARRTGVAEALMRAVVDRLTVDGIEFVDLEVMATNAAARAIYAHWGFREEVLVLMAPVAAFAEKLGEPPSQPSFGSIHVQTDDVDPILKAVEMYVPRLPGRSSGSIVTQPRGGYVTVYDDVCDRDPAMLRRLAKDLSSRTGLVVIALGVEEEAVARMILFDRGGIVDEYASVPEYHGPLPPGEVIALRANPVVVERYTGATQAAVRAATPVADSPGELPSAREVLAGLSAALGLSGAEHGWADAPADGGAIRVGR
jgi:GNAT superfamily N-acetyltransferase